MFQASSDRATALRRTARHARPLLTGCAAGALLLAAGAADAQQYGTSSSVIVDYSVLDGVGTNPNLPALLGGMPQPTASNPYPGTYPPAGELLAPPPSAPRSTLTTGGTPGTGAGSLAMTDQAAPITLIPPSQFKKKAATSAPAPLPTPATPPQPTQKAAVEPTPPPAPTPIEPVPVPAPATALAPQPATPQPAAQPAAQEPPATPAPPQTAQPAPPPAPPPPAPPPASNSASDQPAASTESAAAEPQEAPPAAPAPAEPAAPAASATTASSQAETSPPPDTPPVSPTEGAPADSLATPPPAEDGEEAGDAPAEGVATGDETGDAQVVALPASVEGQFSVTFPEGSSELSAEGRSALDDLAEKLRADSALRVQLLAYAQAIDDNTSRARRTSLSRALEVRSYLIEKGVPSTRMDVRALGSNFEDEPADRVDIIPQAQ